jgi:osomolarity two-component system response regulator SKN7
MKVKNMDAHLYDEHVNFQSFFMILYPIDDDSQCWTFRHPDFRADRKDALENVRRKSGNSRRGPNQSLSTPSPPSQDNAIDALRYQVEQLTQMQGAMSTQIRDIVVDSQQRLQRQEKMMEDMLKLLSQKCRGK